MHVLHVHKLARSQIIYQLCKYHFIFIYILNDDFKYRIEYKSEESLHLNRVHRFQNICNLIPKFRKLS